jgi:hypothetical protein
MQMRGRALPDSGGAPVMGHVEGDDRFDRLRIVRATTLRRASVRRQIG